MNTRQKKKVLYVSRALTPPWDEASKNFAYNLAKHVHAVDVTVMTSGTLDDMPSHVTQAHIYSPAPPSIFSTRQKWESLFYQWKVRHDFDIAHYFFTPTKLNAFIIRTFLRTKKTRTIQTIATLRDSVLSAKDIRNILFADHLVTYTRFAQQLLQRKGFTNVSYAYPGIDLAHYTPDDKDPALLKHFAIPKDAFVILYPGEYTRLGATDMIIDALTAFWRSNHPAAHNTLLVLGLRVKNEADARKKAHVKKVLARRGFADHVRYTDTFADMRGLYNLADIIIFPVANMHGKFDVPLALIEGYACGKPTIVSDIPRLREFTNTDISVIIESENTARLTDAIAHILSHEAQRARLGHAARAFAERHFDITKTAKHYEHIYRKLS